MHRSKAAASCVLWRQVSDPPSIVLTRQDYMRYEDERRDPNVHHIHQLIACRLHANDARYEDERRALRGLLHQTFLEREVLVGATHSSTSGMRVTFLEGVDRSHA